MPRNDISRWGMTLGIALCSAASLFLVERHGVESRRYGHPEQQQVLLANTLPDVYRIWREREFQARIVVHLGRYLHFIPVSANEALPVADQFPIKTGDVTSLFEQHLKESNTLWMAMQANIAREIIHVVPEDDYRSRVASMEENERVSAHVSADRFIISNLGSRRVITSRIPVLSEPVLLVVDASYFRYRDAQQVRQWMESAGLKSDFVVLCFSRDNLNVSDEERQQLSGFAGLFMVQSRS